MGVLKNGADAGATVIFAHGAGLPMDSPFMEAMAGGVADFGLQVVRFEFPYMAKTRQDGTRRPPNPPRVLVDAYRQVIDQYATGPCVLMGKSMGGRIASMIADEVDASAVVCLGYPFHPVGKPEKLRIDHLQSLRTPMLVVQGQRDAFGNAAEVASYRLGDQVKVAWLPDGDHSFVPRKSSGVRVEENYRSAIEAIGKFLQDRGIFH